MSANQADSSDKDCRAQPFTKLKVKAEERHEQKLNVDGLIVEVSDEEDMDNELIHYVYKNQYFTRPATKLVRTYASMCGNPPSPVQENESGPEAEYQNSLVLLSPAQAQPGPSQRENQSARESPKQREASEDMEVGELAQIELTPFSQGASRSQDRGKALRQRATRIYTADYIRWIQRLEQQIASQTVFDVEKVERHVVTKAGEFTDIRALSQSLKTGNKDTDKCKLARCFISSLFLASEGRAEFDCDSGSMRVRAVSK